MGFSSEELKLFVSAATGWNIRWKQHICCWDCSSDCRTVPQNLASSLSRLASQKPRVSSSGATATSLPVKTMLYWLCLSWALISCICHVGSWNRQEAEEKVCPWLPTGPKALPWSMPSFPQHSTQESAMHLTGWFKSWEVWSWPKCHEGVRIQCHFTENGYFRPDLAHIVLGSETRLLLCVQIWQLFPLVILTTTLWSDATDEWLV